MKLIKPSFLIKEQEPGLLGIYRQIEYAGRTCYKSSDRITENSAKAFVDRMIKSGHGAMLEHGTVYLHIPDDDINWNFYYSRYRRNPYSKCNYFETLHGKPLMNLCITTNYRTIIENNWLDDLKYLCEPTEYHAKRACVHFVCDRGVSHEYVRHRVFSFAQESTRYCNYSKDKFGNELTFIIPPYVDAVEGSYTSGYSVISANLRDPYGKGTMGGYFYESLRMAERAYMELVTHEPIDPNIIIRMKPQEARAILPNSLKTELVMTGFVSDWKHFFDLRCASNAHPQARELAIPLKEEFIKRGFIH